MLRILHHPILTVRKFYILFVYSSVGGKIMNKFVKYYEKKINEFTNQDHKKTAIEYIKIRELVNKICLSTKASDITAILYLSQFLKNKPFNKATQDDLMNWELELKKRFNDNSIVLIETKIKTFYKYITNPGKFKKSIMDQKEIVYPDSVKWIRTTKGKGLPITNILDQEQIKKLLDSCKDVREQVIIVSLLDGGLRIGELVNLRIKNIKFDNKLGVNYTLPISKTEQRKVQFFLIPGSTIYVREYLNHHARKNDPEACFLYTDKQNIKLENRPYMALTDSGIWKIVKRIGEQANLKGIHPHYLRHMSATMCCAKGFTEPMLRSRFGWSKSSNMPSHYVHLVSADTDNFIKKILGIKDEDMVKDTTLANIICWNCETENPVTNRFCGRCSANLKPKKEDMVMKATDLGINIQKDLNDLDTLKKLIDLYSIKLQEKLKQV